MRRSRILRSAIVVKPSTLYFHNLLRKRKYRMLFSPRHGHRPGPKGTEKELMAAVVAIKLRNRKWGCRRIAQQIALAFGVEKEVVRRILSAHYRPNSGSQGPSWLSFLGHEGQFVELPSVLLRIGNLENALGSGRDGPIYAADHRVWRAPWRSRRRGAVPDVAVNDWWSTSAKIPELGS
jgi:hypothetical protein